MAKLNLAIMENGSYRIEGDGFTGNFTMRFPRLCGEDSHELAFTQGYEKQGEVGGISGGILGDVCQCGGIDVVREFFVSGDRKYIFVRMKIINKRDKPVYLDKAYPLVLEGKDSLLIEGEGLSDWRFVKTCRQKTDVPGFFDFSKNDENLMDAALDGSRIKAGGGVSGNVEDFLNTDEIVAEPFFYIKSKTKSTGAFFGVLGQFEHLTRFHIVPSADKTELDRIVCECEFDGIEVGPSETVETHWVVIASVEDEITISKEFTEIFAKEYNVPLPSKNPLTVYCTWQFYGFDFTMSDLEENLDYLRKRPIPVDVIQLDNGWIDKLGDYDANHRFPMGMKAVADKIKQAGYTAGIWTCPSMIMGDSKAALEHPELIARDVDGNKVSFPYIEGNAFAVDPSVDCFQEYMNGIYKKLKGWGYNYHKLDFLRSVVVDENIRFKDRRVNRAKASRMVIEGARRALGEEAYILSCGGIQDASNAGIADAVRIGNDMFGFWVPPDEERWKGTLIKVKQNTVRSYTNLLYRADPDACPVRRREQPFREGVLRSDLSLGLFTDEEAFTVVMVQYLSGGNTCICERFPELDEDRRRLLSHIIPPIGKPAEIIDYTQKICPNYFLTEIIPKAKTDKWWTLAVGNWEDEAKEVEVKLSSLPLLKNIQELAVFEFHDQDFYGIKNREESVKISIPPHGIRLLRLAAWDGKMPILLGTDLHFSGGGVEISEISIESDTIRGRLDTPWEYPVTITGLFPNENGASVSAVTVNPAEGDSFSIKYERDSI